MPRRSPWNDGLRHIRWIFPHRARCRAADCPGKLLKLDQGRYDVRYDRCSHCGARVKTQAIAREYLDAAGRHRVLSWPMHA